MPFPEAGRKTSRPRQDLPHGHALPSTLIHFASYGPRRLSVRNRYYMGRNRRNDHLKDNQ